MESNEEKLLAMVQESKMNQAKELMKQKEKELQSKQQPAQSGFSYFTSLLSGVVSGVTNSVRGASATSTPAPAPAPTPSMSMQVPSEPSYAFLSWMLM